MSHHSDTFALRLSLGLIRAFRRLVPAVIRDEWVREWEAEIQHKWSAVNRGQRADWRDCADVVRRSTGAIADAAWLRKQFRSIATSCATCATRCACCIVVP